MNLWIGWDNRFIYFDGFISVITLFLIIYDNIRFKYSLQNVISLACIIIAYTYINIDIINLKTVLHTFIPYAVIILLNDKDKVLCFSFIYKWFAYLMIPSIIVYVLVQTVGLPSIGKIWLNHESYFDQAYIFRDNYLFYTFSNAYGIRFSGPFAEPGHLGMMIAFLLYADGFNLKKRETYILLLALVMTLSLSGFVLLVFAYLFTLLSRNLIKFKYVTIFSFIVLFVYLFGTYYNGGDNVINEFILSRLEYDDEKGFSGNNRVFGEIDLYYASMFTDTNLLLHGYSKDTIEWLAYHNSRGTGYVMWMVKYGVIGTVLAILFYVVYAFCSRNKKYATLMLVFVCLLFWQRSYPFWFAWVICYVYGIVINKRYLNNTGL